MSTQEFVQTISVWFDWTGNVTLFQTSTVRKQSKAYGCKQIAISQLWKYVSEPWSVRWDVPGCLRYRSIDNYNMRESESNNYFIKNLSTFFLVFFFFSFFLFLKTKYKYQNTPCVLFLVWVGLDLTHSCLESHSLLSVLDRLRYGLHRTKEREREREREILLLTITKQLLYIPSSLYSY